MAKESKAALESRLHERLAAELLQLRTAVKGSRWKRKTLADLPTQIDSLVCVRRPVPSPETVTLAQTVGGVRHELANLETYGGGVLPADILNQPLWDVLQLIEDSAAELVAETAVQARRLASASIKYKAHQERALAREVVAGRWPWTTDGPAGRALLACQWRWGANESGLNWLRPWPREAAPAGVEEEQYSLCRAHD